MPDYINILHARTNQYVPERAMGIFRARLSLFYKERTLEELKACHQDFAERLNETISYYRERG